MQRRALVLGSGGNVAYAWQLGLIAGMAEAHLDLRDADAFIGTSAGARLAVELSGQLAIEKLLQTQLGPKPKTEAAPRLDLRGWRKAIARAKEGGGDRSEILRRVGSLALVTSPEVQSERQASIAALISTTSWPAARVLLVAIEAESGERRTFDKHSGIGLLDAVVASSAVPGLFPPVDFRGRHYFDGGFYSTANADVAPDFERILILTLRSGKQPLGVASLEESVERLRATGATVEVVQPDEATEAVLASVGGNVLDPAVAGPAARAGRVQGSRIAAGVALLWELRVAGKAPPPPAPIIRSS